MNKSKALEALFDKISKDDDLPLISANLVFGEGNPNAKVIFIGEAPGQKEDELKRPFVGRAGLLLDKMISSIGWKREEVYITNIVKRRPPKNRDPLPEEIESYKPYLEEQIKIINPKIIAPLGRFAMNYFLPLAKISHDQGKLFPLKNYFIYPIFHPAAALRATKIMNELKLSFQRLPKTLKKIEKTKMKKGRFFK